MMAPLSLAIFVILTQQAAASYYYPNDGYYYDRTPNYPAYGSQPEVPSGHSPYAPGPYNSEPISIHVPPGVEIEVLEDNENENKLHESQYYPHDIPQQNYYPQNPYQQQSNNYDQSHYQQTNQQAYHQQPNHQFLYQNQQQNWYQPSYQHNSPYGHPADCPRGQNGYQQPTNNQYNYQPSSSVPVYSANEPTYNAYPPQDGLPLYNGQPQNQNDVLLTQPEYNSNYGVEEPQPLQLNPQPFENTPPQISEEVVQPAIQEELSLPVQENEYWETKALVDQSAADIEALHNNAGGQIVALETEAGKETRVVLNEVGRAALEGQGILYGTHLGDIMETRELEVDTGVRSLLRIFRPSQPKVVESAAKTVGTVFRNPFGFLSKPSPKEAEGSSGTKQNAETNPFQGSVFPPFKSKPRLNPFSSIVEKVRDFFDNSEEITGLEKKNISDVAAEAESVANYNYLNNSSQQIANETLSMKDGNNGPGPNMPENTFSSFIDDIENNPKYDILKGHLKENQPVEISKEHASEKVFLNKDSKNVIEEKMEAIKNQVSGKQFSPAGIEAQPGLKENSAIEQSQIRQTSLETEKTEKVPKNVDSVQKEDAKGSETIDPIPVLLQSDVEKPSAIDYRGEIISNSEKNTEITEAKEHVGIQLPSVISTAEKTHVAEKFVFDEDEQNHPVNIADGNDGLNRDGFHSEKSVQVNNHLYDDFSIDKMQDAENEVHYNVTEVDRDRNSQPTGWSLEEHNKEQETQESLENGINADYFIDKSETKSGGKKLDDAIIANANTGQVENSQPAETYKPMHVLNETQNNQHEHTSTINGSENAFKHEPKDTMKYQPFESSEIEENPGEPHVEHYAQTQFPAEGDLLIMGNERVKEPTPESQEADDDSFRLAQEAKNIEGNEKFNNSLGIQNESLTSGVEILEDEAAEKLNSDRSSEALPRELTLKPKDEILEGNDASDEDIGEHENEKENHFQFSDEKAQPEDTNYPWMQFEGKSEFNRTGFPQITLNQPDLGPFVSESDSGRQIFQQDGNESVKVYEENSPHWEESNLSKISEDLQDSREAEVTSIIEEGLPKFYDKNDLQFEKLDDIFGNKKKESDVGLQDKLLEGEPQPFIELPEEDISSEDWSNAKVIPIEEGNLDVGSNEGRLDFELQTVQNQDSFNSCLMDADKLIKSKAADNEAKGYKCVSDAKSIGENGFAAARGDLFQDYSIAKDQNQADGERLMSCANSQWELCVEERKKVEETVGAAGAAFSNDVATAHSAKLQQSEALAICSATNKDLSEALRRESDDAVLICKQQQGM